MLEKNIPISHYSIISALQHCEHMTNFAVYVEIETFQLVTTARYKYRGNIYPDINEHLKLSLKINSV